LRPEGTTGLRTWPISGNRHERSQASVGGTAARAISPVYLLPDRNIAHFLVSRIVNIGTAWTAELKRAPLTPTEQACKRTLDVLIASAVLIALAPMMLLVAALIKLESRGPTLFLQTRNGFNGPSFKMCKFRTMSVLEDGPVIRQVTKNDSRVTRFGRLLRRTNIDELPQLVNVITVICRSSARGPMPRRTTQNIKRSLRTAHTVTT
jgi:lipopolysaccharide/colanic/teichoic acid biosynthesis glycosyltransferase